MKRLACVVLAVLAALAATADEPERTLAQRRARRALLTERFASACAEVRTFLKLDADGEVPNVTVRYFCPNCNEYHTRSVERNLRLECPLEGAAFALAPNRFLVQDLHLKQEWVDRYEIRFGGVDYIAKTVLRYPNEEALLLDTEKPVAGVKPLAFSKRLAFADDDEGVYFFATRDKGLSVVGMQPNASAAITHFADVARDYVKCTANAIAVNASNEAVTVSFRPRIPLAATTFAPPSEWRGEPAADFEKRWAAAEQDALSGLVPVYLHLDDENNRKDGYNRRYSRYRDDADSTELDLAGLLLPGGDIVVNLELNASKVSEIDKIEAVLPDGKRVPLVFEGAFADYYVAVFRFADGQVPSALKPFRLDAVPCVRRFGEEVFAVEAANFSGKVKAKLEYARLESFKVGRCGETVPEALDDCSRGKLRFLRYADGTFGGIATRLRSANRYDDAALTSVRLSRLLADRDFDPQFALRQGKDRIRIAWIGVETQRMTEDLAREKKITALLNAAGSSGALVTRVWPGTPAAQAGLAEGDVLLTVRPAKAHHALGLEDSDSSVGFDWSEYFDAFGGGDDEEGGGIFFGLDDDSTPWPNVERGVNRLFTKLGIGKDVVVAYARDGVRKEAGLKLAQAPVHFQTAKRIKNKSLGLKVSDMTFEVRGYFKFDAAAPGVVIVKVQPGNPAAIAGLRPLEIVTHVNNEPVADAKDFAKKVKSAKSLTFTIRRLAATRVVRIEMKADVKDGP